MITKQELDNTLTDLNKQLVESEKQVEYLTNILKVEGAKEDCEIQDLAKYDLEYGRKHTIHLQANISNYESYIEVSKSCLLQLLKVNIEEVLGKLEYCESELDRYEVKDTQLSRMAHKILQSNVQGLKGHLSTLKLKEKLLLGKDGDTIYIAPRKLDELKGEQI